MKQKIQSEVQVTKDFFFFFLIRVNQSGWTEKLQVSSHMLASYLLGFCTYFLASQPMLFLYSVYV